AMMLLLTVGASRASADSITTYTLSTPNGAMSGYTGPYVQVIVDLLSPTTADVTFESLTNGGYTYLMGDGGSAAGNVNATTFTVGPVTGVNAFGAAFGFALTPGPYTVQNPPGSSEVDGFGRFNLVIDSNDGFKSTATQINFSLTNNSGIWTSATNVFTAN